MSIRDYRQQLEQEVAQERARTAEASGGPQAKLESAGDAGQLLSSTTHAEAAPELRAAALGRVVRQKDQGSAHAAPLERLADPNEAPAVRLAALSLLKLLAISSPTFPEWRPMFLEALRRAVDEPALRTAALETLTQEGDRPTQEKLLAGLKDPGQALVPVDHALRLLSSDPHADVREVARSVAGNPPDEAALLQAMKVLAGDPGSVEAFRSLLADRSQSSSVRKLAATALNNLAPELLQPAPEPRLKAAADLESAPALTADESALAKHIGALIRVRREPAPR
ncbi:MAG TPA: hypothetical protein VHG32_03480 [Thermoanaerobaculia bacterium]|jgi:hypothetical protein|nr:hypothetical protein [Thermoanaerobaculia bacterium]